MITVGMKIVLVGSDKIYAIENFYAKHLAGLSVQVVHFPAQSLFYDYYKNGLKNKFFFKLGFSAIYPRINDQLLELVEHEKPDAVWIFKGMEIFPDTLKQLRAKKIKLINYNPDNPFVFSGKGSGNKNITQSIEWYDLHFTYNREIQKRLENDFKLKTQYLPFGFEISDELMNGLVQLPEENSVCFIGNPDRIRAKFINSLLNDGIAINLYGNHWSKFVFGPRAIIHPPVYAEEQWKTLRKYRVQLNMMRIHNLDSHNMRTFEVPGVGGIMLSVNTPEQILFFEDQKEAFFYDSESHCADLIKQIIAWSPHEANAIRVAARNRSLSSGYDYQSRARFALSEIEKIV